MASDYIRRGWEREVYSAYNWIIDSVVGLIYSSRKALVRVREAIDRQFEYYLAEDGKIRIRRSTGAGGIYSNIHGKLVKVQSSPQVVIDDMSIIGWKECNSGQYDEDLGTIVSSKQDYKRLMKDKGLTPLEPTKYCGSNEYRQKKANEYRTAKARPTIERKFAEACRNYG